MEHFENHRWVKGPVKQIKMYIEKMLRDNFFGLRERMEFSCACDIKEKSSRNSNHYWATYAGT